MDLAPPTAALSLQDALRSLRRAKTLEDWANDLSDGGGGLDRFRCCGGEEAVEAQHHDGAVVVGGARAGMLRHGVENGVAQRARRPILGRTQQRFQLIEAERVAVVV